MSRRSEEIELQLHNARTMPVHAFDGVTHEEALHDRAEAIAGLETDLTRAQAEEAGSFIWGH